MEVCRKGLRNVIVKGKEMIIVTNIDMPVYIS